MIIFEVEIWMFLLCMKVFWEEFVLNVVYCEVEIRDGFMMVELLFLLLVLSKRLEECIWGGDFVYWVVL